MGNDPKRFFYQVIERARCILPERYFARWVLPAAVSMLLTCGLPFNAVLYRGSDALELPLAAIAFCCACRCSLGVQSFFASLLGLITGSLAAGLYSGCIAALLFSLALGIVRGEERTMPKYAALFISSLVSLPVCAIFGLWKTGSIAGFFEHTLICALCTLAACFLAQGLFAAAFSSKKGTAKNAYELRLLSFALLGGLVSASFSYARVFTLCLGAAAAAFFCLAAARNSGLASIACAAVIASVRVFTLGGDMLFIAVLCVCTLCAAMLKPLGKWGVLAGFSVPSLALFYLISGTGSIAPAELILSGAAFLLTDIGALVPQSALPVSEREAELEGELAKRNRRLTMLSDVLLEMSKLFNGADNCAAGMINRQLSGVARSLARTALPQVKKRESYTVGIGSAERAGRDGEQTGDTACIREMDGTSLAAISDGMGMGPVARRESEQTVNMVADLICCGFDVAEAAELVNSIMLFREGGETYATLDAMIFDRSKGSIIAAKHGAPASYIVRRGRLNALCAEALPVGIVEEARTAVFSVAVKRGDVIIMMSDGVSDALGDSLSGALKKTAQMSDPDLAAKELIEYARRLGGADDMTAIVAMVS